MNLIPKIAEALGVEIGEEFTFSDVSSRYRFVMKGLQYYDKDYEEWLSVSEITLTSVLTGTAEIEKLPFEPKIGERYFRIVIQSDGKNINVCSDTWQNFTADYMCKYCGNCFRTEAEAEKHKYEIYEKLTGKKWENTGESEE